MYLPKINKRSIKKVRTDRFEGLDRGRTAEDGRFSDICNLSARFYPALSSAPVRYELEHFEVRGVSSPLFFLNRGIYHITPVREDVPDIYSLFKGEEKLLDFQFTAEAAMGNVLNFNSRTLFIKKDTAYEFDPGAASHLTGFFDMGYTLKAEPFRENYDYTPRTLGLSVLYEDMSEIGSFATGPQDADFPDNAEVGDMFEKYLEYYRLIYKDSSDPSKNTWQPVSSVRLRLDISDGYRRFKKGDYVRMKDLKYWNWAVRKFDSLDRYIRIEDTDGDGRYITEPIPVFSDMDKILTAISYPSNDIGYGDVIIDNPGNLLPLLSGEISACMPSMDLICAGSNRVWGCSNDKGEIYASELGNARNFSVFEGLSGDSYAVTVGSDGFFTACCNYLGSPVFFKENEMIVISGSRPASFAVNSYSVRGVPSHSPDGLCVAGDVLYYISNDGVYAYNGSSVACLSHDLGDEVKELRSAVLCGDGDLLYLSALRDGGAVQYTYDIKRRIWHRTSSERVIGYIKYPDAAIAVCYDGARASFVTLDAGIPRDHVSERVSEKEKDWYWETGDISYSADKKYLRKLTLDTSCEGESRLYITYDGEETVEAGHFSPHTRGSMRITVFPRRCDHFRLRMEGRGEMMLYAVTRETEEVNENG